MSQIPLNYFTSLAPSGAVMAFAGSTPPEGWLLCNGLAVSRTTYSSLFSAIGTSHGLGDNSSTFNLPNYQGLFLRGRANGSSNDPDRNSRTAMNSGGSIGDSVGSFQEDSVQVHDHFYIYRERNSTRPTGSTVNLDDSTGWQSDGDLDRIRYYTEVSGFTGKFSSETRPRNASVNYIIKI
jgi:microcystin-dependent protein